MLSSFLLLLPAVFGLGALAQNSTPTQTILLGAESTQNSYAASVVAADASRTTYAIVCESGVGVWCESSLTFSVTEGSSYFGVSSAIVTNGESETVTFACAVTGSTHAECDVSLSVSANGVQTAAVTTQTLDASNSDMNYFAIPLTAGAEKLQGAATRTAANSGVSSGRVCVSSALELVLVGVGAAAVGMAALLL